MRLTQGCRTIGWWEHRHTRLENVTVTSQSNDYVSKQCNKFIPRPFMHSLCKFLIESQSSNCLFQIRYPTIHVMASVLAWASSVVNPFIYAGSNRQYRAAYRKLLCCISSQGHRDIVYQMTAPGGRGSLTHSHSGSGKTFITEMLPYNAAMDKVSVVRTSGTEWSYIRALLKVKWNTDWLVIGPCKIAL